MKQRARWFARHPRVTVGRARNYALEKTKHASHFRSAIERGNDVHFGSAWIRKTGVDPPGHQGAYQAFRSVHFNLLPVNLSGSSSTMCC
jgi:hypothetical protein